MRKLFVLLVAILSVVYAAHAQDADKLEKLPVKRGAKDAVFDKAFSEVIAQSRHYFKGLQNDSGIRSIMDTTYKTKFGFKENNEADLTFAKDYVSLGIRFSLNSVAFNKFSDNLQASLPANFVYTREYDASSKQVTYTFFAKEGTKTVPPGYPEKLSLTSDAEDIVTMGMLIFRK